MRNEVRSRSSGIPIGGGSVRVTRPIHGIRFHAVAAAYALWLFGVWGAFYLAHGKDANALQLAVMCGAIPAICHVFLLGIEWRGLVAPVKLWLAYLLVILLSYVANSMDPQTAPSGADATGIPAAWTPIVYSINAAFIMGIGILVAGCPDRRLLRSIAGIYCILSGLFLVYIDLTGKMVWGRLSANDLEPNNWGLMGLTVCLAALARKAGPIAIAGFAVGLATILLASSREHLITLPIVLLVGIARYLATTKGYRLMAALAGLSAILIMAAVLLDPYIVNAVNYINSDVLLLDSRDRGIDSGFTGRTGIWAETFNLWLRHPLFGVGYRQHERFLAGWPAHNAYLAVLADTGVFGMIVYLALLIKSFIASWDIQDQRTRRFIGAVILSYIVIGFFDRRTIDAGNPFSLFFLMACSVALADHSLRKVAAIYRRASAQRRDALTADPPLHAT